MSIVGPRVVLRLPVRDDLPAWSAVIEENRRFLSRWINLPTSAEDPGAQRSFEATLAANAQGRCEKRLILDRDSEALVGVVNLNEIVRGSFWSAYAGYWIIETRCGAGLMTEALGLALRHAFETLALHRIEANIQPDNAASIGLVRKLGFVREGYSERYLKVDGQWRDHERWAITVERWQG